jgi:alpha-glucoside transport system substrate-binding protein
MSLNSKLFGVIAFAAVSSVCGTAQADVCDTPSALGDLGDFAGEVITIAGSMEVALKKPQVLW